MTPFRIGPHTVGAGRCFLIGEVAQAHDGSLGTAHAFIDAIASAGADAVKFQTHIAEAESSPSEPWRVKFSPQDETRFDYWKRMEFTEPQWKGLRRHAEEKDLVFLSSPFSLAAAEMLDRLGMEAWKIASGEITNQPLMDHLMTTRRPILVSTGMSPLDEVDGVVARLTAAGTPFAVMQCTSSYPVPPEKLGLNLLTEYRNRYDCPVGLSDHSGTIFAGLAAATLGADILEVHVTMSREMFGPDVVASVTTAECAQLASGLRFVERALRTSVDKQASAVDFSDLRHIFTRSLLAAADLPAGTTLERRHLVARKPGTGIPADRIDTLVGRRLARAVERWAMLTQDDLE